MRRKFLVLSWALYDTANQFFALNVVSLYFPRWLTLEKGSPEIFYSLSFGISLFLVAICAPIMGAISDMRGKRREFLVYFTILSVIFTVVLGLSDNLFLVLLFFAIANFGCQAAVIFYNALMVNIARRERLGFVSGFGRMFGYAGAILALYFTKPVILNFGYKATFIITGVLFLIFSLPCLIFVKDKSNESDDRMRYLIDKRQITEIFRRLKSTLFESYKYEGLRNFLKAAFFGLCVVNAIILFMAIYISKVFHLTESQIINLIAFSTLFAIIGSFISGIISDLIGCKNSLIGIFCLWVVCLVGAAVLYPPFHWLIGALVGLSLGSIWVVSRALVVKLVPKEKIGEVFGIFNLVGYASGIIGAFFWGAAILFFSALGELGYRVVCLSSVIFFAIGFVFLLRLPIAKREV